MDKKQIAEILTILKVSFPNMYNNDIPVNDIINVWYVALKDYDFELIKMAVNSIIITNKFPPTIADIVEKVNLITKPNQLTENEAWDMVYKAICNSAYNSAQEFKKLPSSVKRAVGSHEMLKSWSQLPTDEVQTVIQSNFMRSYKSASKQEKEHEMLPENVKKFTLELANKMDMKYLEGC